MAKKVALITGITGQDGSYLAELLLSKEYEVHGIKRRSSQFNTSRIDHLYNDIHDIEKDPTKPFLKLHYGDLTDSCSLDRIIEEVMPDEIYNLGAQSHVGVSFECPEYTAESSGIGTLRILESIKKRRQKKDIRFYQASTSELFGKVQEVPQNEKTAFYPRSPYAAAKLYAYWITINYRESFGIYACNGILFNHESPRRGETFVTKKITVGLTRIELGLQEKLYVGNLNAKRDWGHARDYVKMQWLMLQQDSPKDYVIATGEQISVREFIDECAALLGWGKLEWSGKDLTEVGMRQDNGKIVVEVDARYFRPTEVETLLGDASEAKHDLGWEAQTSLAEMIKEMISFDLDKARQEKMLLELQN